MSALLAYSLLMAAQAKPSLPTPTEPPLNANPAIQRLEQKAGLKFDDLFPRQSFFGQVPGNLTWSPNDRYLLYTHRKIDEMGGADLYLMDAQTGETKRLTTMDLMARFDRDIPKAKERYTKDKAEEDKSLTLNDLEYREWRLKRREENEKRREPLPSYPGVGGLEWSPNSDAFLMVYRGDIFQWKLGEDLPKQLTKTRDAESRPAYTSDGKGFTFQRGSSVYRAMFDSPMVEQLNPELPTGQTMSGYNISPDGTKLMVISSRWQEADRKVTYISYKERFAKPITVSRGVADDEFKVQTYIYLYDIEANADATKGDGKPWEIWKWPGGKEWQEDSISPNPWSPDSKRFVFATWKRISKDFEIAVADIEKRQIKTIYKSKPDGEHTTPGMANPMFTKDGKNVITLLDASGFRHAWMIDPTTEKTTQLTDGTYEAYPQQLSEDGKKLFVMANKEHQARNDLYSVDLETKRMDRVTRQTGFYNAPAISDSGKRVAIQFRNWATPNEVYVLGDGEKKISDSHRGTFDKVNKIKPELFTFKNREGFDIHGFMFLPPGFKKTDKRPLMIYVYGGPLGTGKSVEDGSYNSTAYLFNMYLTQVLGFVTCTIDTRGQSGYGNVFGKANWQKPGEAQVVDLADTAKYMIANYGVDPKKVAVNGWSFGGYQTQMCMFTAPDVFTLGIAGAGPTEWQNYNTWYSTGVIAPNLTGKPEDLDKYSLTHLAKNLRSPLMLLHGMEDDNVLFQDTVAVYRKLLQYGRGPLVELALDPTGGHGMGGDMDNRDRHAIYLAFINRWWGPFGD